MAKEKKNKTKEVRKEDLVNDKEGEDSPKRENKLVVGFNLYKFILKLVAAVLLLVFGIVILVEQQWAIFALLFTTGAVAGISALVRICLLVKNGKCPQAKRITAVESLIILLLGGFLVGISFVYEKNPENAVAAFTAKNYGIFLALILYVKAVGYFWEQVLYKEKTTKFMFWLHIGFITCAVLFAAVSDKIDAKYIVITLAVIALLCALLIGGEAATGYFRYRRFLYPKKEKSKEKEKSDEDSIEAPARDSDKEINEIDPAIIPHEDNDKDSSIIS